MTIETIASVLAILGVLMAFLRWWWKQEEVTRHFVAFFTFVPGIAGLAAVQALQEYYSIALKFALAGKSSKQIDPTIVALNAAWGDLTSVTYLCGAAVVLGVGLLFAPKR